MNTVTNPVKLLKGSERKMPTAAYQSITPEQASKWLETSAKNRLLNSTRVAMYAAAMVRGDWMLTNQGIAFDEFGALIDGQHRLHAIVKANVPVTMLVIESTPNRSQLVLDQGLKRTPHDQIALREGWQVYPIHSAVAKAMIESIGGIGLRERRDVIRDIQLLDRFYVKHHKAIEFAVSSLWTKHGSLRGVIIAPTIAPIARAYYSTEQHKLTHFCDVLATGMGEGYNDSPIIVLRNWLIAAREKSLSARAGKDRNIIYKKTEIALNAYLKGESIQRLGQMTIDKELFLIPGEASIKIAPMHKVKKAKK